MMLQKIALYTLGVDNNLLSYYGCQKYKLREGGNHAIVQP
jgi:hypothetical protein